VRFLAVIPYNSKEIDLLARLIRAEAEGEGQQGMLLVGNVGVNRVRADCLDFRNIRSLSSMIFQSPGGFEATQKSYFYQPARDIDRRLARRVINGERFVPATTALWFYNPFDQTCRAQWWGQWNSGRYKSHCFYQPLVSENCY
jgi:N-acetylmuramoyl-L-alanine amidase